MTIPELIEKCKTREIYTVLLIIFVGFASFGLGRLSRLEELRDSIRIEPADLISSQVAAVVSPPLLSKEGRGGVVGVGSDVKDEELRIKDSAVPAAGGQLVASKGRTKYHFPWCSGAQRISEANKVWFNSVEEARKAGYTPARNCKGLK